MKPSGRPLKPTLYTLPHGIEVIGEYAPKGQNKYWRVRIRHHHFFQGITERSGGIYVRRSRVVLASKLGRPLTTEEHAHHDDENRENDRPENIEIVSPQEHNRHHKIGVRHADDGRQKISKGLKKAYAEGRRKKPIITKRDSKGRILK
jgi:HNH endonuclease